MKFSMKKKCLTMGIILLFVGTFIFPASSQDTKKQLSISKENRLYVNGNDVISQLYFIINSNDWSYDYDETQIQITRNNSQPYLEMQSSYQAPFHQLRNLVSDNITTIHEESTSQVTVIKLSSVHEIQIKNLSAEFIYSVINTQKTDLSNTKGLYVVDSSGNLYGYHCSACLNKQPDEGTLQYFKLGPFIYNNRAEYEHVGWVWTAGFGEGNFSLPSGDWYFIFYAGFYDVPNNNTLIQTNISINIIDIPNDLKVTKNVEGTFYGYWYGEINPVLFISKAWEFELMVRGTKQFFANNTFFFQFFGFPVSDGYWSIRWETPTGIKKCNMEVFDGRFNSSSSEEEINWCINGMGGSGNYGVITHSFDRAYGHWRTSPLHLSAIDVPLK
jgi:hypothetical protein